MKKTAPIEEMPKKIEYTGLKKYFFPGQFVRTTAEVQGMPKNTKVKINSIENEGEKFICQVVDGPLHGATIKIMATDLE